MIYDLSCQPEVSFYLTSRKVWKKKSYTEGMKQGHQSPLCPSIRSLICVCKHVGPSRLHCEIIKLSLLWTKIQWQVGRQRWNKAFLSTQLPQMPTSIYQANQHIFRIMGHGHQELLLFTIPCNPKPVAHPEQIRPGFEPSGLFPPRCILLSDLQQIWNLLPTQEKPELHQGDPHKGS